MTVTQFINSALTEVDYLTTELNALDGDAVGRVLGAAINNSSDRYQLMKVQIYLPSVDLSAQPSPGVGINLIESIDGGTVYEDNDDTCYGITLPIEASSQVHVRIGDLYVPPGYFKLEVTNNTGVDFAGTLNVLSYAFYTPETDV